MVEKISKILKEKIVAKGLTVSALEKKAGLKPNAIRNIILGRIKKPTIKTLVIIADALDSSLDDLLDFTQNSSDVNIYRFAKNKIIDDLKLYSEVVSIILNELSTKGLNPTLHKLNQLINEVYFCAIDREIDDIDISFIKWVIYKNLETNYNPQI